MHSAANCWQRNVARVVTLLYSANAVLSVRPSVCLCRTRGLRQTVQDIDTHVAPHDRAMFLVFLRSNLVFESLGSP